MASHPDRLTLESVPLFLVILLVLAIVTSNLNKPNSGPNEDIQVLRVRLHIGHGLNTRSTTANDSDTVFRPLFLLVILVPSRSVEDLALESILQARDVGPFEVIENASAVKQEVTPVFFLLASLVIAQLHAPSTLGIIPVSAYNFGIEGHVLSQVKRVAYFVEVLPDIR